MQEIVRHYLGTLADRFGSGWTQFWFAPSGSAALSLMRPLVGALAIWWHATYTADLIAFFGPGGVIPLELLTVWSGNATGESGAASLSYFHAIHTPEGLWLAHWLGLAILLAFTVGLFTRLTSVLSLVVILSYIHRGPMLTSEFEPVLAMVMFYFALGEVLSLFEQAHPSRLTMLTGGVCGARFSVDQLLRDKAVARLDHFEAAKYAEVPLTSTTVATRLLQVHLVAIYAMSGLSMFGSDVWWAGEAVWWLVARPDQPSFGMARRLYDSPFVINLWTHFIMFTQLAFAVLVWNRLARPLMVVLAVCMWLLVALASGLYLFSLIMLTATLAFVAPEIVEKLLPAKSRAAQGSEPVGRRDAVAAGPA